MRPNLERNAFDCRRREQISALENSARTEEVFAAPEVKGCRTALGLWLTARWIRVYDCHDALMLRMNGNLAIASPGFVRIGAWHSLLLFAMVSVCDSCIIPDEYGIFLVVMRYDPKESVQADAIKRKAVHHFPFGKRIFLFGLKVTLPNGETNAPYQSGRNKAAAVCSLQIIFQTLGD